METDDLCPDARRVALLGNELDHLQVLLLDLLQTKDSSDHASICEPPLGVLSRTGTNPPQYDGPGGLSSPNPSSTTWRRLFELPSFNFTRAPKLSVVVREYPRSARILHQMLCKHHDQPKHAK